MRIIQIIFLFILFFLLIGCKAKIKTIETHSIDTLYIEKIVKITPAQLNSITIESPCDSLGNLKPFFYTLGKGNDKLIVKTIDNTIYVEQNLDSIKQVWEKERQISISTSDKSEIIYKTPSWNWKVMGIMSIIIAVMSFIIVLLFKN